jgi:hypothetical protein
MTRPGWVPALLQAAGTVAGAGKRLGMSLAPWSARARARILRMATVVVTGSLAVVLALSLVGVNSSAAPWSPTLRSAILASIGIAAALIGGARRSAGEGR